MTSNRTTNCVLRGVSSGTITSTRKVTFEPAGIKRLTSEDIAFCPPSIVKNGMRPTVGGEDDKVAITERRFSTALPSLYKVVSAKNMPLAMVVRLCVEGPREGLRTAPVAAKISTLLSLGLLSTPSATNTASTVILCNSPAASVIGSITQRVTFLICMRSYETLRSIGPVVSTSSTVSHHDQVSGKSIGLISTCVGPFPLFSRINSIAFEMLGVSFVGVSPRERTTSWVVVTRIPSKASPSTIMKLRCDSITGVMDGPQSFAIALSGTSITTSKVVVVPELRTASGRVG